MADSAPWMHDGRALTLTDAINMHDGTGADPLSVAAAVNFAKLGPPQKVALLNFLRSLRTPIEPHPGL